MSSMVSWRDMLCRLADFDFVERHVGEIVRRCPVVVAGVPASAGAAAVVMAGWEASTAVEANSANTLFSWYLMKFVC